MAQEFTNYLAATVLNEGSIVTYRSLARVLKVHNNIAKCMLYDFHEKQNAKKPGCVHATYLVSGVQVTKATANGSNEKDGDDVLMRSSPFMSSSMPQQDAEEDVSTVRVMTLVQEQHLEILKSRYESIFSIHIYSLEPNAIQNLQILSEVKRDSAAKWAKEDPLVVGKQYGTIQNQYVKRRTGPRPATMPVSVAATSLKTDAKPAGKSIPTDVPDNEPKGSKASQPQKPSQAERQHSQDKVQKPPTKRPVLKREQSDIFKSFSKPKAKTTRENTGSSSEAPSGLSTPKLEPAEDVQDDASEDEKEEDVMALTNDASKDVSSQRKSRSEREEVLRKMMDDEDEPMENAADEPTAEADDSQTIDEHPSQEEALVESSTVVAGSRRRGRRKVMKKKMLKDEEGYLVTKEEPAWESFSEDEPPPLAMAVSTIASSAANKTKRASGKPGQGNIMSFFGKK